jgi:hypothetical protein
MKKDLHVPPEVTAPYYKNKKIRVASAGNRTRINCLEGSYADHYTTDAPGGKMWH